MLTQDIAQPCAHTVSVVPSDRVSLRASRGNSTAVHEVRAPNGIALHIEGVVEGHNCGRWKSHARAGLVGLAEAGARVLLQSAGRDDESNNEDEDAGCSHDRRLVAEKFRFAETRKTVEGTRVA